METKESDGLKDQTQQSSTQYQVEQINVKLICKGCSKYIEKIIRNINGVKNIDCNTKTGLITIHFISSIVSLDKIELAISNIGYDTLNYKRKVEFYSTIPKCCRYYNEIVGDDDFRA